MKISIFSYALLCLLGISLACCESKDENLKSGSSPNDKWEFAYEKNFVDSLDAIYNKKEGVIALFGYKDIPTGLNITNEDFIVNKGRIICITRVNKDTQTLDESMATIIVCDSTLFPIRIANKDINIIASKRDEYHFDCIFYNLQKDEWIECNNLEYNLKNIEEVSSTRALATGGYSEFNPNSVLKVISIATNIVNGIRKGWSDDVLGFFYENLQILSQYNDEVGLAVGVIATPGWFKLLPVAEYLTAKLDKLILKEMGKVHFTLEDPKIIDGTTCEIFYEIDGLHQYGIVNTEIGMEIYNKSGYFNYSSLKSGNYKGSQIWANLSTGQYTVELYVRSKKFQWLEFRAMKTIYMFELELDHYDINPKIKYVNDEVTFDIDVYLKGDNNELNEWIKRGVQFGYYIKYSNNTPEYYPVANFSSIFEMTPLTCKLIINKNNFPEEYKNYSTYEAIAIDYYIGTYATFSKDNITHLDEKPIDGLIYKEKPFTITQETISTTETSATLVCEYGNNSFWNLTCGVEYYWKGNKSEIDLGPLEDGEHKITLTGLKPSTTYTYRSFMKHGNKYLYADNEKTFTTNSGCHIDFNIEYPNYSDSKADEVVCRIALLPVYENEDQRNSIIKKYAVLYKDGKEVTRSSYEYSDRIILTHVFKREELSVDYVNYTAVPKDGHWQASMEFEKLNEKGEIITMPTDVMKDVNLKYDTKPVMVIYKCDIGRCDAYPDPNYTHDEHRFLIKMSSFTRGSFWRKSWIGNSSNEVIDGKVHRFGDDFSLGGNWGVDYTNNNKPNQLLMEFKDYNGNVIKSNSIPIQTNEKGCVIESHYDNTSEVISKYGKQWNF